MLIDIAKIAGEEIEIDNPLAIDLRDEGNQLARDPEFRGIMKIAERNLLLKGRIKAEVESECVRCLLKTPVLLDFSFAAKYIPAENYLTEKSSEIGSEDLDSGVYDGERLDISEAAREQILLELPEKVLCRDDCKGLCADCGSNLNNGPCDCGAEMSDPRWAALKEFRK